MRRAENRSKEKWLRYVTECVSSSDTVPPKNMCPPQTNALAADKWMVYDGMVLCTVAGHHVCVCVSPTNNAVAVVESVLPYPWRWRWLVLYGYHNKCPWEVRTQSTSIHQSILSYVAEERHILQHIIVRYVCVCVTYRSFHTGRPRLARHTPVSDEFNACAVDTDSLIE